MDCNVRNANYQRVMIVMERLLKDGTLSFCSCERCLDDVAAIALNYLPPHYYVEKDDGREVGSPWVMVQTAVNQAIETVKERPHHDR